ncbi:hypothetical protein [Nonomuraea sp. NEAU-A123]|uniref:hypothetical protein n=1 Tax=Nonomuraea sp. NEAU-A123 TaxID=2839649 RepID=UPI001BE4A95E|nr:hypothetical protein [Nonomuraea sp. NEAU-A123]MBT2234686.1 hypothetical protein [Nonomuraea sp. NEAU-A123]
MLATEIDPDATNAAKAHAEDLQRCSGGWWLVLYGAHSRRFFAFYAGWSARVKMPIEARTPAELRPMMTAADDAWWRSQLVSLHAQPDARDGLAD